MLRCHLSSESRCVVQAALVLQAGTKNSRQAQFPGSQFLPVASPVPAGAWEEQEISCEPGAGKLWRANLSTGPRTI